VVFHLTPRLITSVTRHAAHNPVGSPSTPGSRFNGGRPVADRHLTGVRTPIFRRSAPGARLQASRISWHAREVPKGSKVADASLYWQYIWFSSLGPDGPTHRHLSSPGAFY
jgi:hypothetical protein